MKHILTIMAVSLTIAAVVPNTTAGAIIGATEITQILNNVELMGINMSTLASLEQQIESKITLANQYIMQGQQYITQMKQLQSMVPEEVMSTYRDAVELKTKYENLHGAMSTLYGDISNEKQAAQDIFRDMSMKGLTPEQYVAKLSSNDAHSRQVVQGMLANMSNGMRTVQQSYEQVRKFQAQIPYSEGIHESMQTLNSQMNAQLAQQAQFIELATAGLQDTMEKNVKQINQDEQDNEIMKNHQNRQNDFARQFNEQFNPNKPVGK